VYSYAGGQGEACSHCHATTVNRWETTGHAMATAALAGDSASDPYCLQCHTTGWDSPVEHGGEIDPNNRGPNDEGYDDYFEVDTEEAMDRREALANVQCEACHGPMGDNFPGHKPLISFATQFEVEGDPSTTTGLCYPCHETQLEEWNTSSHSLYNPDGPRMTPEEFTDEWGRSSCDFCHTSEGFIRNNDPRYATYEFDELYSYIGCPTCHDPHAGAEAGGNEHQLRNLSPVEVAYFPGYDPGEPERPRMEGKGTGQACAQCHHARRDNANVANQIANGSGHMGPHPSCQMDMYIGYGSYEIPGYDYEYATDRATTHNGAAFAKACVTCHMTTSESSPQHVLHTFEPSLTVCTPCHGEITSPDISITGGEGRQTKTLRLLDELAQALGYLDHMDFEENFDSRADGVTNWEREAAYAFYFVWDDASLGVHNPFYSETLLQNAIDYANAQNAKMASR
jgi:hypothetical protein